MRIVGVSRVLAWLLMARGTVLLAAPHQWLRFWTRENLPPWLRNAVRPWLGIPGWNLRVLGAYLLLIGGLMLGLSRAARQAPSQ